MSLKKTLRALGCDGLPAVIELGGRALRLERTFKHDAISAVGLYGHGEERAVMRCYRTAPLFGLPMGWLGNLMARYEAAALGAAQGIRGVPGLLGHWGRTGLVRQYVPGRPLTRDLHLGGAFFRELFHLLRRLHRRGLAYVDLEKPENILLGDDGLPYLIDFQIAFHVPDRFLGGTPALRWLRRQLQRADIYHARKHVSRLMEEELGPRRLARLRRRPRLVKVGNALHAPFKQLRRWVLARL